MVSMVMPETGLRAVVAMAFAATEVKKNEKTSASTRPDRDHGPGDRQMPEEDRHGDRAHHHAEEESLSSACRDRCAPVVASPWRKARSAIPNEPATTLSDLTMPKMPAVAIAPTPMKRT